MRALIVLFSAVGLVLGGAAAVLWHYTQTQVGHDVGWFAYAPLNSTDCVYPPRPGWWPTAFIFPAIGLVVGGSAGAALARLRWRLTRG